MKRLYKSRNDRKIDGICGGLAEYLNIDATVVRVIWAIFSCFGGAGVLAYLICALIVPEAPKNNGVIDAE